MLAEKRAHRTHPGAAPLLCRAPYKGIRKIAYRLGRETSSKTHFHLRSTEGAVLDGQAVARVALKLKQEGLVPDVILGHNAWGETLYLKDFYPDPPSSAACLTGPS